MNLFSDGFKGGVHPPYTKITAEREIEKAEIPDRVALPLRQHVGAPCDSLVEEGDEVKVGQKIGDSESLSAPIHATVSGTVTEISTRMTPTEKEEKCVIIDSDGEDEWVDMEGIDPEEASDEEIIEKVKECGVAGLGGAGFPTHVKLSPPEDKNIDTVLINGAECEPYITSDHRLMLEKAEDIVEGAGIVKRMVDADQILIGIEENKPDAIEKMKEITREEIKVVSLEAKYPQGDEYHFINAVLDREIPEGGLPFDVGVAIQNVGTAKAIRDAVYEGKPLVERAVTVTGSVQEPKNLIARLGTSFYSLIEYCGGPEGKMKKLISGGPMMGTSVPGDVPTVKGTNCILVFSERMVEGKEERECIRCSRCVEACPMNLMPFKYWQLVRNEEFDRLEEYNIRSCDNCGCCAYVCPAKIPLVDYIQRGKEELD